MFSPAARRTLLSLSPLGAYALLRSTGPDGAPGAFRAGVGALGLSVVVGAWLPTWSVLPRQRSTALLVLAATSTVPAFLEGAGLQGALAATALVGGAVLAVWGFAALGLAVGASPVGAGAVGSFVLLAALTGLSWADVVAERLPVERRFAFRQAVLHVDPATAWAYDVAGFDRLHHPPIYASVPLASSFHERPRARHTAVLWAAVGATSLLVARWLARQRSR